MSPSLFHNKLNHGTVICQCEQIEFSLSIQFSLSPPSISMYLQVSSIAYVSPQNLESTWSGRMWGLHAKCFNLKPSASFSNWLPFGAVCMETRSKRRLLWASNVCVERISFKLQALSLVPRILVSNRTWERIYLLGVAEGKTEKSASKGTEWFAEGVCPMVTVNQRPQRLQILQAHVDIVVWEQQPAYGSRVWRLFQRASKRCKRGCKWLQVAASGCKWLQVAAWASGYKWLLGQVAASGCNWLQPSAATRSDLPPRAILKKKWFCRFTFFFKIVCSRLLAAMHQQLPALIETLV